MEYTKDLYTLLRKAEEIEEHLIKWRRDFHQYPELGFEEKRTSNIVADHLKRLGLEVKTDVGKTGVVGLLKGKEPGPTFALRADMDALPITEQNDHSFVSKHEGTMHACGHDAHTAILMGAAQILSTTCRPEKGTIKFIFQPAEEGLGGAQAMIEDGVLDHPKVNAIAGLHVNTGIDVGHLTISEGRVGCGAADEFNLKIIGRGGHAAHPHQAIDSISVASEVISSLQHIASRHVDPTDPLVITIGKIVGGSKSNVIAPEVNMSGTVRTLNPDLRKQIPERMEKVIKGVTEALGADYEFDFHFKFPSILNEEKMVDLLFETSSEILGENHCKFVKPSLGGEDFSFYTEHVPAVFFRLGVGSNDMEQRYPGHHPKFDIDEKALKYGSAMLSKIALNYLQKN